MSRGTIILVGSIVTAALIVAGAIDYSHIKGERCVTQGQGFFGGDSHTCGHVNAVAMAHGWAWIGGVLAALLITAGAAAVARPHPSSASILREFPATAPGAAGPRGELRDLDTTTVRESQDPVTEVQRTDLVDTKLCPDCAESVKEAARVCRFCGFRFDLDQQTV